MIFYFSATGNSLSVARTIAERTHDTLIDLGAAFKRGRFSYRIEQGENLGFVMPVYWATTPWIVDEFIRWLAFITPNGNDFVPGYCYVVFTCGHSVGKSGKYFQKLLKNHQNIRLDAAFSVRSVDNCISHKNPGSDRSCQKRLQSALKDARQIAYHIDSKRMAYDEHRGFISSVISTITCREQKRIDTKHLSLNKTACTQCGICTSLCPTNVLFFNESGTLNWDYEACTRCYGCVQHCPERAINYQRSAHHHQWIHPILLGQVHSTHLAHAEVDIPEPEEIVHPGDYEEPEVDEGVLEAISNEISENISREKECEEEQKRAEKKHLFWKLFTRRKSQRKKH